MGGTEILLGISGRIYDDLSKTIHEDAGEQLDLRLFIGYSG